MGTLASSTVRVGVLSDADEFVQKLARIHEYGGTITPKTAKYLTIPLTKEAKLKRPREIDGAFVIATKDGGLVIVRDKRKYTKKGSLRKRADMVTTAPQESDLELLYALKRSVTMPERSFIRASYDAHAEEIASSADTVAWSVIDGGQTAAEALDRVGAEALGLTQKFFNTGVSPPKGELTQKLSTQKATLYDTGLLYGSISYEVTSGEEE